VTWFNHEARKAFFLKRTEEAKGKHLRVLKGRNIPARATSLCSSARGSKKMIEFFHDFCPQAKTHAKTVNRETSWSSIVQIQQSNAKTEKPRITGLFNDIIVQSKLSKR